MKDLWKNPRFICFWLIIVIAVLLRFTMLTSLPAGINQDEADASYESYSLLHHGTDKWGNPWPIYFISWGSGQNVLESYLEMPVIALFGLNTLSARVVPATLGVGSVVLLFFITRKLWGTKLALLAAFLLAISPWAVMSSRFAVESNLLPFFVLLGIFSVIYSYGSPHRKYLVPLSLIPFGLALYAYLLAIFITPILVIAVLWIFREDIPKIWKSMALSIVLLGLLASPLLLFLLDNQLLHRTPNFVAKLPFNIPLLLDNRLAQAHQTDGNLFSHNTSFVLSGFRNDEPWAAMPGFSPTAFVLFPLGLIGAVHLLLKSKSREAKLFSAWLLGSLPLFFLVGVNGVRGNTFMIPLTFFVIYTYVAVRNFKNAKLAKRLFALCIVALVLYNGIFLANYFTKYNRLFAYNYFNNGFQAALKDSQEHAKPSENIYVSSLVNLNYVYTLFYLRADSKDFQRTASYKPTPSPIGKIYKVTNYGRYFFDSGAPQLIQSKSYIYILKWGDTVKCASNQVLVKSNDWTVGRCSQ